MPSRLLASCFFLLMICAGHAQVVIPAGAKNHLAGTVHIADSFVNDGMFDMAEGAHFYFSGAGWRQNGLRNTSGRGTVYLQGSKHQILYNPLQLYKVIVDNAQGVKGASLTIDSLLQLNAGAFQSAGLYMQNGSWLVRTGGSLQQAPQAVGAFNLLYPLYAPLVAGPELVNTGLNHLVVENIQGVTVRSNVSVGGSITGMGTLIFGGAQQQHLTAGGGFSIGQLFVQNSAGLQLKSSGTVSNVLRLDKGKLFLGAQTLTLPADADITYSAANYIVAGTDAARLIRTGFSGSLLYPVGTENEYMPVTVTQSAPADFSLGLFKGLTTDATADGAAMPQKKSMLDAVWITESTRSGAILDLHWSDGIEGADFKKMKDAQIGMFGYNGSWKSLGLPMAASNITNTVRFMHKANGRIAIGMHHKAVQQLSIVLEGRKLFDKEGIALNWHLNKPALMKGRMVLEHSLNGTDFGPVYEMATVGLPIYNYVHLTAKEGLNYYRIVCYCESGVEVLSNTVVASYTEGFEKMEAFPNPTMGPLTVRFTTSAPATEVMMIYNAIGQLVQQSKVQLAAGVNDINMNLSKVQSGIYIIKLRNSIVKVEKID